ncbi:MAG: PEP-CTERM sorting domain-containing protein [Acidobacteria bacterium]|nr:PEP-CTERM sorting domain-containing protein [Acidobacteriota bacterium]
MRVHLGLMATVAAAAFLGAPAQASFIGDTVTLTCVAQFPSPNTDCLVGGGPSNVLVGAGTEGSVTSGIGDVTIDVAATSIVLAAGVNGANFNGLSQILTISDLDWVGGPAIITGVNVSTSGTFNPLIGPITFTSNSVQIDFGVSGWFAGTDPTVTIDIETTAVPEPGSVALLATGLIGIGWLRRRKAARN